jgi:hypothetical protein
MPAKRQRDDSECIASLSTVGKALIKGARKSNAPSEVAATESDGLNAPTAISEHEGDRDGVMLRG